MPTSVAVRTADAAQLVESEHSRRRRPVQEPGVGQPSGSVLANWHKGCLSRPASFGSPMGPKTTRCARMGIRLARPGPGSFRARFLSRPGPFAHWRFFGVGRLLQPSASALRNRCGGRTCELSAARLESNASPGISFRAAPRPMTSGERGAADRRESLQAAPGERIIAAHPGALGRTAR